MRVFRPEEGNEGFFEIAQGYEFLYLEMLNWAEANIKDLIPFAYSSLKYQVEELVKRGYSKTEEATFQNVIDLNKLLIPENNIVGLTFVDKNEVGNLIDRQFAVHKGFHNEDAAAPKKDIEAFSIMESAPMFKNDLEIIAKYDNKLIGLLVVWIDDVTRQALIEPASIHPEYQRKGIGKQLVLEALRRIKNYGINIVYVESYGE